ncbi:MAG: T9SS type B sorting domain-containing protein, partial [Maribacter sp.]
SDTAEIVVVGFPKFFSPNGDGINDLWHVQGISVLDNPIIYVYDRFGKLLKQMNENTEGWDGTYNGMILPASDYWFKLTYLDTDGQTISAKYINSHFSLKR